MASRSIMGVSFVGGLSAAITKIRQLQPMAIWHGSLILLCYKQSQAPSVTKRAGGELLDKMFSNLNS